MGNNSGSCLLHLTGAAITIKFPLTGDSASWPYNCIRQFRADEDTRQFSFFSGRRGPYGVAEYKFDMTERMLLEMQDALTQFTGAQFGQNPTPGTGSGNGFAPESVRSPKRDPLPQVPGTPPTNQETHAGYTTHQANFQQKQTTANIFGTLPPRYRQESLSSRPPVPAPYDSHTMGSRGRQGSPSINTKYSYHEVTGGFPPGAERGVGFSGSTVPGPIISGRKMSHGDEVFSSKTMRSVHTYSNYPTLCSYNFSGTNLTPASLASFALLFERQLKKYRSIETTIHNISVYLLYIHTYCTVYPTPCCV